MSRQEAPIAPPVVLTIAGSDSGGGAGIQADVKTIEACGGFGTSAITSVTAQNTRRVAGTHVLPVAEIEAQIDAVLDDFDVAAVKTGMLAAEPVVDLVGSYAPDLPDLVVDPVMVAATGDRLLEREAEAAYEGLLAEARLVTPNADEAAVLTGIEVEDEATARRAGEALVEAGTDAALVKGGHLPGEDVLDTLVTAEGVTTYRHDRIDTEATHGSGCALSSVIATRLAHGEALPRAVADGIDLLGRAVRYHLDVGRGPGAVHHLVDLRDDAARAATIESVEGVVAELEDPTLAPDRGLDVAGATPAAESPDDVATVEGRVAATPAGLRSNRGVRFGVDGRLARLLLAAREHDPALRFALSCGADAVADDGEVAVLPDEQTPVRAVDAAVADAGGVPAVLLDPPDADDRTATVLSATPDGLLDRL